MKLSFPFFFTPETVPFSQRRCTIRVAMLVGGSLRSLTPRCEEIIQIGPKA